jgi:hypothetical protein
MIDEHDLRALLTEAAEAVPPPGGAPQALLDAIEEQAATPKERRPRPRRLTLVAAAAAAVAVVAVGINVSDDDADRVANTTLSSRDGATAEEGALSSETGHLVETQAGGASGGTAGTPAPADRDAAAADEAASGDTGSVGPPTDSAKIIRTGSLDLEVGEGAFQSTVERIRAQAVGLGGYVAEATTSESGDSPSGSITVRVPGDSFDQLLSDVRKLGDVQAVTSKGTDVTAQFTDLEARLKALTATRDRLHTVLAEADVVPDILAVQDRITAVQIEIEQVQGEQKLLEDQTAFGTLAITLGEPGAEIIEAEPQGDGGLGGAWDDARRRFGDNIETIVSWSGSAAVALVVALGALLLVRFGWVGLRRRMV